MTKIIDKSIPCLKETSKLLIATLTGKVDLLLEILLIRKPVNVKIPAKAIKRLKYNRMKVKILEELGSR